MSDGVVIPRSVSKQGELAERIISTLNAAKQVAAAPATPDVSPVPDVQPDEKRAPVTPPTEKPSQATDTPTAPPVPPTEPTLAPKDSGQPTPELDNTETVEHWKAAAQTLEHKYAALAGKYNAEIERQKHLFYSAKPELEQLRADKQQLEATIQALKQPQGTEPKDAKTSPPATALQSPEIQTLLAQLRDEYGEELVNGFMTIISAVEASAATTASKLEAVNTAVETVRQSASVATKQQEQQMYQQRIAQLTEQLSQSGIVFQQVDNDPLFHEWLSRYDATTGQQRQAILMGLFQANELSRVAGMYAQYIQDSNAVYHNAPPQPQAGATTPNSLNLNEQVQIDSKAPIAPHLPTEQNLWTNQSIATFYQNVAKGKYSKEEAARLEKEIFAGLKG